MKLATDFGGDGSRLLVLLHGLGATRQVWQRFVHAGNWQGSWLAPDLRGHGLSPRAASYALGTHAADIADLIAKFGVWDEIVVVGHSMGGAIALTLASGWFGIQPASVFALAIKVAWNAEEIAGLERSAASPPRMFENKDDALARYLKVSGLSGLVDPGSEEAAAGIVSKGPSWRLAYDPAANAVGAPPMSALMAAARTPVHLVCGEHDGLVDSEQLRVYDPTATALPGGHNVMVENPIAVWRWIDERLL